jgi:hypothetical protein
VIFGIILIGVTNLVTDYAGAAIAAGSADGMRCDHIRIA